MTNIYILTSFRILESESPGELAALRDVFGDDHVVEHLYKIPSGSLVIPRFRALPFGDFLEDEIEHNGSKLINSYSQHRNIANSRNWAHLLKGLTPDQYIIADLPYLPEGEYFAKGETNSRKNDWFGSSYAPNKKKLIEVIRTLQQDSMISNQEIIIKPYQHFKQIAESVTEQPIFHERRAFVLDGELLSSAPYWTSFHEAYENLEYDEGKYNNTLEKAMYLTQDLARFYAIDLAEYPDGTWAVVELNDGPMSGLSGNDPELLWNSFLKMEKKDE